MKRALSRLQGWLALLLFTLVLVPSTSNAASGDITALTIANDNPQKLAVSQTVQLKVMADIEGLTSKHDVSESVTWTTSDASIVTVTKGKAKALKGGNATLTASLKGATAQLHIQVEEKITKIQASPKSYRFAKGGVQTLPKVTITRGNGAQEDVTNSVKWSMSASNAVLENGSFRGVTPGRVTLEGTYGGKTVKIPIAIEDEIVRMEVTPAVTNLNIKKSKPLKVTGYYSSGKTVNLSKQVSWVSSNPSVATVKNGSVKTLAQGEATLTGTYQNMRVVTEVRVVPLLKKLVAGNSKVTLAPGNSTNVGIFALYDTGQKNVVTSNVEWTSSKPNIVTVNNGRITAVSKGKASIKAKWNKKTITINVTVK
ncbi:Bacterial Ig-like domain (group 2) [compost metagenome]